MIEVNQPFDNTVKDSEENKLTYEYDIWVTNYSIN